MDSQQDHRKKKTKNQKTIRFFSEVLFLINVQYKVYNNIGLHYIRFLFTILFHSTCILFGNTYTLSINVRIPFLQRWNKSVIFFIFIFIDEWSFSFSSHHRGIHGTTGKTKRKRGGRGKDWCEKITNKWKRRSPLKQWM